MKLAVDLDSTLSHTIPAALRTLNSELGTSYTIKDVTSFSAWEVLPALRDHPKGRDKFYRSLDKAWEDWQSIEIELGAVEAMRRLKNAGLQIDIVTGRSTTPRDVLESWLRLHGIPYDNLIVTEAKPGEERRTSELKTDLPYDIWIDDNPYMATAIKNQPEKLLLLFYQPWNRDIPNGPNVVRVYGWQDTLRKLGLGPTTGPAGRRPNSNKRVRRYSRHI